MKAPAAASAAGTGIFYSQRRGFVAVARLRLFSRERFAKRRSAGAGRPTVCASEVFFSTGCRVLLKSIRPILELVVVLGDAGFVLPASGGLAAALWGAADRRAAFAFLAAVAACGATAAVAKILFMAFGPPPLHSPSGHAALAAVFFLSLSAIFMRIGERGVGLLAAALCAAVAMLVPLARIAAAAHTEPEAFAGFFIGLACFGLFLALAPPRLAIGARTLVAFLMAAVALYAYVGFNIGVEEPLERIATRLARLLSR